MTCHDTPEYFVVSRDHTEEVGTDLLVKYKTRRDEEIPCVYRKTGSDFEIKNEGAVYFFAVVSHFLVLDEGTAPPPRGLILYDLNTRKQAYIDSYSEPVRFRKSSITYWRPLKTKADAENCPLLGKWLAEGMAGAEIEEQVVLDLPSLTRKNLGKYRCKPTN